MQKLTQETQSLDTSKDLSYKYQILEKHSFVM